MKMHFVHLVILAGPSHMKAAVVDSSRTSAACLCKAHGFWQQQKQLLPCFHVTMHLHENSLQEPSRMVQIHSNTVVHSKSEAVLQAKLK